MPVRLTFDDGPDPIWSPRVLDALDAAGVRATFFVIGQRLAQHPQLALDAQARGHSIQPHCFSHDRVHRDMSAEEIEDDVQRTLELMRRTGLVPPTHLRPPGGWVKPADTEAVAQRHGLRVALWHVDPEDWKPESTAERMLDGLRREETWRAGGNSVVVLHDGRVNTPRTTAENTVAVIGPLAHYVRGRGWEFGLLNPPPARAGLRKRLAAGLRRLGG